MKIIAVLKGDLKEYKKVDIGLAFNYGVLKPAGKDLLTVVATNVIFPDPEGAEKFEEPKFFEKALITVDYNLVEGIDISTLKVWSIDAKEAAKSHIKSRNNRYLQMAKTFAIVQHWNKIHKGDHPMLVNVDTIGQKLVETGTTPDKFIKDYSVKPKQLSFSAILKANPTHELIL